MRKNIRPLEKEKIIERLNKEVFESVKFNEHVKKVAETLNLHEIVVKDVLVDYITKISLILNTVQNLNLKINIIGFFSFILKKHKS